MSRFDKWLSGGLRTVMVPSGEVFRLKVPEVEEMLTKGLIPDDLRQIALKFGASSVDPATMDQGSLAQLLRFMRTLVANALREMWDADPFEDMRWQDEEHEGDPWKPVTVTVGMLEEGSIDGDDYAALQGICAREFTPNQITALSLRDHGKIDRDEAQRRIDDERGGTTPGWQSFRGGRRGTAAGGDSGAVESPPVRPNRRQRRSRSGARTGAG